MSLNKFMHPRNIYRKPPDFKVLAIKYPDFRKYAKQDISGKVSLNFKDLEAVRALTRTLLLEDFNLDVEIPINRLIPTLPLRLNYVLWIEDLLESNKRTSDVKGIDIGCGASCVYPLLAAKQFSWQMLATEVDTESAFIASKNIKKNNLQNIIKVRSVNEGQMLVEVIEPDTVYDFCMCNPPFFSSTEELDHKNVSRSPNRPAPRNAHSGTTTELVAPGGETAFVAAIIRESKILKAVVRIYSVMVGHKTSVGKVKKELQEAGIAPGSITSSEFCQGRTTRWGVAWTLDPTISFQQPSHVTQLKKKKVTPMCHTFKTDLSSTVDKLKTLLEKLQITYKILKMNQDICAMEITALENTWSNSRKKRREEKLRQKMTENNNAAMCVVSEVKNLANNKLEKVDGGGGNGNIKILSEEEELTEESESSKIKAEKFQTFKVDFEESCHKEVTERIATNDINPGEIDHSKVIEIGSKRSLQEEESADLSASNPIKKPKLGSSTFISNPEDNSEKTPILHGSLVVKKINNECSVELTWLKGSGGKDSAHQVLQYLKNNYEPH